MIENLLLAIVLLLVLAIFLPNADKIFSLAEWMLVVAERIAKRIRLFLGLMARDYRRAARYPYYS